MRLFSFAAVLVAVLAVTGSATAAPSWRAPFVASTEGRAPAVAVDNAGNTYIAWTSPDGLKVSRREPGTGFAFPETVTIAAVPETQLTAGSAIGVDAAGNVTIAWLQQSAGDQSLMSARRAAGGGWEPPTVIDASVHPGRGFALSVGAGGTAAVAYVDGLGSERLTVAIRPAGTNWGSPEGLGTSGTVDTPRVAVGADGTVAASFGLYGYGPHALVRPATTGVWGSEVALASSPQNHASAPSVAVDDGGGTLVAWIDSAGGGDYRVNTRYRPTGDPSTFAAADALADLDGTATGSEFFNGPALAFDGSGNATVVWRQFVSAAQQDVYGSTRPAGGTFGAPQPVTTGGSSEYVRLALTADGTALLVWRGSDSASASFGDPVRNTGPVFATTRPAGGAFDAGITLTPRGGTVPAVDAGASGSGIAAWGHTFDNCSQVEAALWNEGPAGPFDSLGRLCSPTTGGGGTSTTQTPMPDRTTTTPDTRAPKLALGGASAQRALRRKVVSLSFACDEDCDAEIDALLEHKPAKKKKRVRSTRLRQQKRSASAGKRVTVKWKLSKKNLATIRKMRARRGTARLAATFRVRDDAGNTTRATRRVTLR
jgi:hypothetical protein